MSPSPIETLTLATSGLNDCFPNKYKMNIVSNQDSSNLNSSDLSFDTDSPEFSQSPSIYSSQSSLACSPKKTTNATKSIDIKNTTNSCIKSTLENTIQTPTSNDLLFESLNNASFSFSFDKISNSSFMDYFNLPDSYSASPSINYNLSINNGIELKENESGNCCLFARSNNNDVIMRKKKISFSSNNCLFPNFDDFDFTIDQSDSKYASESIKFIDPHDNEKLKTEKLLDLNDLSVDDSNEFSQIENHDTLIAIREMAIRERRSQQRKHKNSTSSVSSTSMSSRIKKFAIDLQNTTSNITLDNQNFKPVPIYTSTTNTNNNTPKSSLKIEYFLNNLSDHDQAGFFGNDLDIDRFNIDVDDTDLSQLLELEGWEEILDEDCISRLTTDFSNQNFLTKRSNNESDGNSFENGKEINLEVQSTYDMNTESCEKKENQKICKTSTTTNCDQIDSNSNLKLISPTAIKIPTRTVLNPSSVSTIPKISNTNKKSQPVVVVLSSSNSIVANKSLSSASNDAKSCNQLRQIIIENGINKTQILNSVKNSNSINQALNITNNQIKRLNLSENLETSSKNEEKIHLSQTQTNIENCDKTSTNKINGSNTLNYNEGESKSHYDNKDIKLSENSTESMSSSLIDPAIEVIDCINPDQIFPYRTTNKKEELHFTDIDSIKNWTKSNTFLENNLKTELFDDEEEEEIDVVSINQNNNNFSSLNSNNNDLKGKNNIEFIDNSCPKIKETNNTTLNHHNYFNQTSSFTTQSINIQGNRKTPMNFQNNNVSQHKDQSSLLAKCLKSESSRGKKHNIKQFYFIYFPIFLR